MMIFKNVSSMRVIFYAFSRNLYGKSLVSQELEPGQFPYLRRQIPLDGLKTFEERCKEIQIAKTGVVFNSVNIGYDIPKSKIFITKEKKIHLEMSARKRELIIDVNDLDNVMKKTSIGIKQRVNIARRYHIYDDIFTYHHFFYPIKSLDIFFRKSDDTCMPVFYGNMIAPQTAMNEPNVKFDSDKDSLWTLIMTSPDEHLEQDKKEYIHWMMCNISIKDSQLINRDIIVPYLQPIPYLGTGFHRYVIVLYKQDNGKLDLSKLALSDNCFLEDRTFSTYNFLKDYQDVLTPVGLSFFQSSWDNSVRQCFREKLKCLEPSFEYKWPKEKLKPQEKFPENKVMHTYLDQYRDVKDIQEEVLKERLKDVHPFSPPEVLEYPLAVPSDVNEMGFVKEKYKSKVLRRNQWKDMDINDEF